MVTAAEIFQAGPQYDKNMSDPNLVTEYLRKQNNQITPIINGNKLVTSQSHALGGDCKVFYMDMDMISSQAQNEMFRQVNRDWAITPLQARMEVLRKLGRNLMKHEYLLRMLENHYRFVPQEAVSDYDLPIIIKFIESHVDMWISTEDNDVEFIVFEEDKASLHFLALSVCRALAQTSRPVVVATHTSAPLAYLFVSLCLESGVPKNSIQLYIVDKEQLDQTSALFCEGLFGDGTLFEEPSEVKLDCCGCSVVVTESADLHSALDSLITGVTFTRCYPWAVSSVFVQESVYAKFQAMAEDKLSKAVISDSPTFVAPSGSEHLFLRPDGPTLVFGDCRIVDMGSFVTIQPYRTTKELLNIIKYPARFALSVWCDSVSIANEISIAADVSTVWINMYGVFDFSPQAPVVERHGGMIQQLGAEKILYQRDKTLDNGSEKARKELIEAVSNLKEKKAKWVKCSRKEKLSKIWENLRNTPEGQLTAEQIINLSKVILHSEYRIANTDVTIINGKMNVRILRPIGTVMIHDVLGTDVLTEAIVSVLEGNSILYISDDKPNLSDEVLKHLSKADEIPVVAFESDYYTRLEAVEVSYATKMFDAIARKGYYKFYQVKNIWSPIGESFAN